MAGRHNERSTPKKEWKQPDECNGCRWGNWDGVSQFCMWQKCIKEDEEHVSKEKSEKC